MDESMSDLELDGLQHQAQNPPEIEQLKVGDPVLPSREPEQDKTGDMILPATTETDEKKEAQGSPINTSTNNGRKQGYQNQLSRNQSGDQEKHQQGRRGAVWGVQGKARVPDRAIWRSL